MKMTSQSGFSHPGQVPEPPSSRQPFYCQTESSAPLRYGTRSETPQILANWEKKELLNALSRIYIVQKSDLLPTTRWRWTFLAPASSSVLRFQTTSEAAKELPTGPLYLAGLYGKGYFYSVFLATCPNPRIFQELNSIWRIPKRKPSRCDSEGESESGPDLRCGQLPAPS